MRDEIISAFKLVVSNAETLETFSFKEDIRNIKMVWTWHQDSPDELRIEGPNQEQVSAFLLIFRQFIQKNDRCSFKYLASIIFSRSCNLKISMNFLIRPSLKNFSICFLPNP